VSAEEKNSLIDEHINELKSGSRILKLDSYYSFLVAQNLRLTSFSEKVEALKAEAMEEVARLRIERNEYAGLATRAVKRVTETSNELKSKGTMFINAKEQTSRLELEIAAKNKELMKLHDFHDRQQKRHAREIEEKEAEARKATAELKLIRNELSHYKQAQKQMYNLEATIFDLKNQLEAKELALGMASGNREDTEARAAAAEAENLELKKELDSLRIEKENFQTEKNRLLAFRTNPEAERDRIEKAVRGAVTPKDIEIMCKDSQLKTLKGEIRSQKTEIRHQKVELEAYERGRIVDQNMLRELSGDSYRLKDDLKDAELYHASLEDRVFSLEQKLADAEASAEALQSELLMLLAK
jgi:chromosome segregation ATPase